MGQNLFFFGQPKKTTQEVKSAKDISNVVLLELFSLFCHDKRPLRQNVYALFFIHNGVFRKC